jgi:hypothetical protein
MAGCGQDPKDDLFVSSTNDTTANTVAILGLEGTAVSSSNSAIATAEIAGGKIKIISVSAGTATITVSDASDHTATISVTVSDTGAITLGTIVKYTPQSNTIVGDWIMYHEQPNEKLYVLVRITENELTVIQRQYTGQPVGGFPILYTYTKGEYTIANDVLTFMSAGGNMSYEYSLSNNVLTIKEMLPGNNDGVFTPCEEIPPNPFIGIWEAEDNGKMTFSGNTFTVQNAEGQFQAKGVWEVQFHYVIMTITHMANTDPLPATAEELPARGEPQVRTYLHQFLSETSLKLTNDGNPEDVINLTLIQQ